MKSFSFKIIFAFALFCLFQSTFAQYQIPEKPAVLYPVYDEANLLTQEEKDELNDRLTTFSDSTFIPIQIVIISSTEGENVNFLAKEFGKKWETAQDNGILLLVAKNEKTAAVESGQAINPSINHSISGQITDYLMTPNFRKGKWFTGINESADAVIEISQGKFQPLLKQNTNSGTFAIVLVMFFIFMILMTFGNDFKKLNGGR